MKILHLSLRQSYDLGELIPLPEEEAHHLRHVLRHGEGALLAISDGERWFYQGLLCGTAIRVTTRKELTEPKRSVFLYVSPIAKVATEELLRRATELGVVALYFVEYQRSERHWDFSKIEGRWQRLLREAAKSTGRGRLPRLHPPRPFAEWMREWPEGTHIVASLPSATPLVADMLGDVGPLHLWLGPEGDFTENERDLFLRQKSILVTLGKYVYRTEIASIIFIIKIQELLNEL